MTAEQTGLLKTKTAAKPKGLSSIPVKYMTIIPALAFVVLGIQMHTYAVNEWTQNEIRTENFPNTSFVRNFSACNESKHSSTAYTNYKKVQQESAEWIAFYNLALHAPALLSCLILPCYTDALGRRFLFILSSVGLITRCGLTCMVIYAHQSFLYVIGIYALDGILGSSYALYTVSYCYVADITHNNNQRVLAIVFIQFVVMATTVLSSLVAGYTIQIWDNGYLYTALLSLFISFVGFFIFAFLLPESLSEKHRRTLLSKFSPFKWCLDFYLGSETNGLVLCYILLLLAYAFSEFSGTENRAAVETLYFLGPPFCWGPSDIGIFQMTRHASQGILGLGCVKFFQKLMSNEAISILSSISTTSSFFVEAYASSTLMIYMVPVVGLFGFLLSPLICGIMSSTAPPNKQGSMLAGLVAIRILSSITASFTDNEIYAATVSDKNSFVFLIMAAFGLIDTILLVIFCCVKPYQALGAQFQPREQYGVVNTAF